MLARKSNKRNRNIRKAHIYKYVINTALIDYSYPTYTAENLNFDIPDLLYNSPVFKNLQGIYSQFRLNGIGFHSYPRQVNGTDPAQIWIYLDMQNYGTFNYVNMPELQGSRKLSVKKYMYTKFRTSGRNMDFGMWKDLDDYNQINSGLSIRLHSKAQPNESKFWSFQISFYLQFRGFRIPIENNTKSGERVDIVAGCPPENAGNEQVKEMKIDASPDQLDA